MCEGWDLRALLSLLTFEYKGPARSPVCAIYYPCRWETLCTLLIFFYYLFFTRKMSFSKVEHWLSLDHFPSLALYFRPARFKMSRGMFFPQRFQVLSNFPKVSSYQNVNYLFFALVCEPALENYLRPRKTLGERSEPKVSKLFRPRPLALDSARFSLRAFSTIGIEAKNVMKDFLKIYSEL